MTQPEAATSLAFTIRDGRESDRPYITHAWILQNAQTPMARLLGAEYTHAHRRLVWAWLPECDVRIACDTQDADAIMGFLVRYGNVLHYVHVRSDFRRFGIAKALAAELVNERAFYTHELSDQIHYRGMIEIPARWTFNPYPFLAGPKS